MPTLEHHDVSLFHPVMPLFSQPTVVVVDHMESSADSRSMTLLAGDLGVSVKIYDDAQFEVFDRHVA